MSESQPLDTISTTEARSELKRLFLSLPMKEYPAERSSSTNNIFEILTQHPEFCLECFEFNGIESPMAWSLSTKHTPLGIFLLAKAGFHIIEQVCNLNPKAIMNNGEPKLYPLQIALKQRPDPEVIPFLARQWPEALRLKDSQGRYPIQRALNPHVCMNSVDPNWRNYSRTAIGPLVVMYPDPLDGHNDQYGNTALGLAITCDLGPETVRCLVERIPTTLGKLQLRPTSRSGRPEDGTLIDVGYAKELVKLLPQLKQLSLYCHGWTREGLVLFLQHLRDNTSIDTIRQLSLPFVMASTCPEVRGLLRGCCSSSQLKSLVLSPCFFEVDTTSLERYHQSHEGLFSAVAGAGQTGLEKLDISSRLNLPSVQSFMELLLTGDHSLQKLTIPNLCFLTDDVSTSLARDTNNSAVNISSCLQSLILGLAVGSEYLGDSATQKCFNSLVYELAKLPSLKALDLRALQTHSHYPKLQGSLEYLLSTAPCLKSLTLRKICCDEESVVKALRNNATLDCFTMTTLLEEEKDRAKLASSFNDLLENYNVTLKELWIHKRETQYTFRAGSLSPSVLYYLTLNRCGRVHARNPNTTLQLFVNLLLEAPVEEELHSSVLYGLLRELPELWCQNNTVPGPRGLGTTGKRKRSE